MRAWSSSRDVIRALSHGIGMVALTLLLSRVATDIRNNGLYEGFDWAAFGVDTYFLSALPGHPGDRAYLLATQLPLFYGAALALLVLWLLSARMVCGKRSAAAWRCSIALAVLGQLMIAALAEPSLSTDLYSYIAHGVIMDQGWNPYQVDSDALAHGADAGQLIAMGWVPIVEVSPYGPVWSHCEYLVVWATGDVSAAMVVLQVMLACLALGSAYLTHRILGVVAPAWQQRGTLLFLWNPALMFLGVAEGHNDLAILFLGLLALYLGLRLRPYAAAVALCLSVLTKYTSLLFLLPLWRFLRPRVGAARTTSAAMGAVMLACALVAPLWGSGEIVDATAAADHVYYLAETAIGRGAGQHSGELVRSSPGPGYVAVEAAPFTRLLHGLFEPEHSRIIRLVLLAVVAVLIAARTRDEVALIHGCAVLMGVYIFVISARFYPWYALVPIALATVVPRGMWPAVVVWTGLALLLSPGFMLMENGHIHASTFQAAQFTAVGLSALALLPSAIRAVRPQPRESV